MSKRDEFLRLIREMPEEKVTELLWFLEDSYKIALEDFRCLQKNEVRFGKITKLFIEYDIRFFKLFLN